MEDRTKIIEKIKVYLEEKLSQPVEERFIICSMLAKEYLEEMEDEGMDDFDEVDEDDTPEEPEYDVEDDKYLPSTEEQKEDKVLVKKPNLKIKGGKAEDGKAG